MLLAVHLRHKLRKHYLIELLPTGTTRHLRLEDCGLEAVSKFVVNEPFGAGSVASASHSRQAIFRAGRLSR
jgi:hypothetical protein